MIALPAGCWRPAWWPTPFLTCVALVSKRQMSGVNFDAISLISVFIFNIASFGWSLSVIIAVNKITVVSTEKYLPNYLNVRSGKYGFNISTIMEKHITSIPFLCLKFFYWHFFVKFHYFLSVLMLFYRICLKVNNSVWLIYSIYSWSFHFFHIYTTGCFLLQ